MSSQTKVNLYSAVDMRNECNEKLSEVLESLKFNQSYTFIDAKLILGYISLSMAGVLYYLEKEYNNNFNDNEYVFYNVLAIACFFGCHSVSYIIANFVEVKNSVYTGYDKKGNRLDILASIDDSFTEPIYKTSFIYNGNQTAKLDCDIEFSKLFNEDGYLQPKEFRDFLIRNIEKVSEKKNQ